MLTSWITYDVHNHRNEFLDSLAPNSLIVIALILQPTRITSHSNTFVDNKYIFRSYWFSHNIG